MHGWYCLAQGNGVEEDHVAGIGEKIGYIKGELTYLVIELRIW